MVTRRRRPASGEIDVDEVAPFVEFPELVAAAAYRHDEHVTIVGPTGCGKTTIALELLRLRRNVVIIGTKPKDPTLERLLKSREYVRVTTLPHVSVARRLIVWPRMRSIVDTKTQSAIIGAVMDQAFREGNRTLCSDETHYLAEFLRLAPRLKLWWTQGRSNGLSLVACFQRPAWVPRDAYSSATHLFLFGTADDTDAKALGGIGGLDSSTIRYVVKWLAHDKNRRHEFLYVNTRTGYMVRSRLRK